MQAWEATGLLSPDGMFPFSQRRNGMVLGEGAGILVLESLDHARARGAKVLAELCGLATTADSTDMLSPDLDGASETMRLALEDAGLAPIEIDYVNAHGAATPAGDRVETHAIRRTFGAHAEKLAVSATKPMYGNPLGASGAIEAVICIKAMQDGWVPPTLGLDQPDPECDLDYVPNTGRQRRSATRCRTPSASRGSTPPSCSARRRRKPAPQEAEIAPWTGRGKDVAVSRGRGSLSPSCRAMVGNFAVRAIKYEYGPGSPIHVHGTSCHRRQW